jgi:hypothetical protein
VNTPSGEGEQPFRCSALSHQLNELQFGTASTVRSWILLEQPGPWGVEVPIQSRLRRRIARALHRLAVDLRIRVVLIRRHGRSDPATRHCYLARTAPDGVWMEHAVLRHPAELLQADLTNLARGEPVRLGEPDPGPLFLVCTNGRRDPCCAERGRPLARALDRAFGDRVWECSHIGGDRFAGNLVCFPHGMYFGRLDPSDGPRVAAEYARGVIDLDHYRGRPAFDFAVQAAEHFLRVRRGLVGVDDLTLVSHSDAEDGRVSSRFADASGSTFSVTVAPAGRESQRLTCHSAVAAPPRSFELVELS